MLKKKKSTKKQKLVNEEYLSEYVEALAFGIKKPEKEKRRDLFKDDMPL